MLTTPILFLIYRRPEKTQRVFDAIRQAQPKQLFVGADGPKEHIPEEKELCEQTRKIIESVDWDCEVKTLYQKKNIGSRFAESAAMDWFFSQVEEGIILEDDCLPNQSFFKYCQQLLQYYRNDEQIMHISGENLLGEKFGDGSYYFARIPHIWGWATWRRAWKKFDVEMSEFPEFKKSGQIKEIFKNKNAQDYWMNIFEQVYAKKIDAWDYIWTYTILTKNGKCINSNYNFVSNIGFGPDGTYSLDPNSYFSNRLAEEIDEIIHPSLLDVNNDAVNRTLSKIFGINL